MIYRMRHSFRSALGKFLSPLPNTLIVIAMVLPTLRAEFYQGLLLGRRGVEGAGRRALVLLNVKDVTLQQLCDF